MFDLFLLNDTLMTFRSRFRGISLPTDWVRPLGASIKLIGRLIGVHSQAFIGGCCYQTIASFEFFFACGSHESTLDLDIQNRL